MMRSGLWPKASGDVVAVVGAAIAAWTILAALAMGRTGMLDRFLGGSPLWTAGFACVAGVGAVAWLRSRGVYRIVRAPAPLWAMLAAAACAAIAIVIDIAAPLPAGITIAWPMSLAFYPAIALVAEFALHAAPLAILWAGAGLAGPQRRVALRNAAIVAVVLIEPLYQLRGAALDAAGLAFAVNILAFNVLQLHVYRRNGFAWMVGLRLIYYAIWHIVWGAARAAF